MFNNKELTTALHQMFIFLDTIIADYRNWILQILLYCSFVCYFSYIRAWADWNCTQKYRIIKTVSTIFSFLEFFGVSVDIEGTPEKTKDAFFLIFYRPILY
jgi:hypothetical protein